VFFGTDASGTVDLLLSLHVDDTLVTGTGPRIAWLHGKMQAAFGPIKQEQGAFRHFGVDVVRDPQTRHVYMSQEFFIQQLWPVVLQRVRGDGRTADTAANDAETTEFRSLTSGIAWVGVTHAGAQAAASLFQNALLTPAISDLVRLNCFLDQLRAEYAPLCFRHGLGPTRIVCISDSSLGNASRYSQGGYFLLLANSENDGMICGNCTVIAARSSKSKRVASSTMHAETLALASGLEEAGYLQTWLHELNNPHLSTWDLLHVSGPELTPIVGITDCNDLYESLIKPAMPTPSNRALVLYLAALREQHDLQKVQAWAWCDTRDNLAAVLTKLNDDGTLPLAPYTAALRFSCWEPVHAYR
jgi:hypothetical protein